MEIKLTKAQHDCVSLRGKSQLVSSGAGSGKTMVLAKRIAELIASGEAQVDEILVVTFTRAAASQMKRRIRKELNELCLSCENPEYLKAQIRALNSSFISTLHSFCMNLIREFYYVIEAEPTFNMLSDDESAVMRVRAAQQAVEESFEAESEDFERLVLFFCEGRDAQPIINMIVSALSFCEQLAGGTAELLGVWALGNPDEGIESLPFARFINEKVMRLINEADEKITLAKTISEQNGAVHPSIDSILKICAEAQSHARQGLGAVSDYLFGMPELDKKTMSSKTAALEKGLRNEAVDLLRSARELVCFSSKSIVAHTEQLSFITRVLCELCIRADQILAEEKERAGVLDFSDLEQLSLKILENDEVCQRVKESFKYVFVDEYQDVNEIQELIISKTAYLDNLFAVGDVKQSIYGFRGADPKAFINRAKLYEQEPEKGALMRLSDNFRTDSVIIDGINFLFSKIMFESTGGIDYFPNEELIAGKSAGDERNKIQVRLIPPKEKKDEDEPKQPKEAYGTDEDTKALSREARYTALLIDHLLLCGIYDDELKTNRRVRPNDICVIRRDMNGCACVYEQELEKLGIPASASGAGEYFDELEVALCLNILRVVDNSKNDMPLIGVMRSFLFNFTDDELTEIRLCAKNKKFFHQCVALYLEEGESEKLRNKIAGFFELIDGLRVFAAHDSLERLIGAVYEKTRLLTLASALPSGQIRKENLNYLIRLASSYEQGTFRGLDSFISYVDKCRESGNFPRFDSSLASGESVRLMTVHKSKGLEFEIVIFGGCAKNMLHANTQSLIFSKKFGLCAKYNSVEGRYKCDSLMLKAAKEEKRAQEKAEEMRILYVGATRAKKQLYFTGALGARTRPEKITQNTDIIGASSYLEWIFAAFNRGENKCTEGSGGVLFENDSFAARLVGLEQTELEKEFEDLPYLYRQAPLAENEASEEGISEGAQGEFVGQEHESKGEGSNQAETDAREQELLYEKIAERLSYVYPHSSDTSIPSKLSVSSVKQGDVLELNSHTIELSELPAFDGRDIAFTPARIGTLTHRFFEGFSPEEIDLSDIKTSVDRQIKKLAESGVFSPKEGEMIDRELICGFFQRDVGRMLLGARELKREQSFIMKEKACALSKEWEQSGEEVILQGTLDCCFVYEGKFILLDYKTDRVTKDNLPKEKLEQYTRQIMYYKKALEEGTGKKVDESYICFLRGGFEKKV